MGIHWRWNKEAFKRSTFESLLDKVVREILPGRASRKRRAGGAARPTSKPKRQSFTLEPIEPRLLLSADLSYGGSGAHEFWVKAIDSTQVQIFTDAGGTQAAASAQTLSGGQLTIERGSVLGANLGDINSDTIHIDTDSFSALDASATGISAKNLLDVTFDGGDQRASRTTSSWTRTPVCSSDCRSPAIRKSPRPTALPLPVISRSSPTRSG